VPLGALLELKGCQLDDTVQLRTEGNMDAFVDGKTGHLAILMVHMGADRTDPVGTECDGLGRAPVNRFELADTLHATKIGKEWERKKEDPRLLAGPPGIIFI